MPDLEFLNIKNESVWVAQIFLVVFGALLLDFIQRRVINRLAGKFEKTKNYWDDAFLHSAKKPISLIIWVIGLSFAAHIAGSKTDSSLLEYVDPVNDVLIIVAITWFLLRFIKRVEEGIVTSREAKGEPVDLTTMDAVTKLLRLSVAITAALVALQTLGFSVSGVLAFGGVGGIAVGFAARDLLANFFGGLMVYLDRPFSVGDWIRSPDRNIEGTVEKIGWRQTMIRTFDKRPLYIPNATFTNVAVENPSRMTHRRIYETIGVRYDDADRVESIVTAVETMLRAHPDIDSTQTLIVNFNKFAASSLDFFVYTFTHTTNWVEYHKIKQDVLLRIYKIITDHNAEVAFPTSTVHVPEDIRMEQIARS